MAYWIFKVNPKKYRIDARLADPEVRTTWQVTRYSDEIRSGDTAFIWRTGSSRRNRGLCATMKITSNPIEMPEIESEIPYYIDLYAGPSLRVLGELLGRFPLIRDENLRTILGLHGLSVFHGFQMATNFRVTEEEGQILAELIAAG